MADPRSPAGSVDGGDRYADQVPQRLVGDRREPRAPDRYRPAGTNRALKTHGARPSAGRDPHTDPHQRTFPARAVPLPHGAGQQSGSRPHTDALAGTGRCPRTAQDTGSAPDAVNSPGRHRRGEHVPVTTSRRRTASRRSPSRPGGPGRMPGRQAGHRSSPRSPPTWPSTAAPGRRPPRPASTARAPRGGRVSRRAARNRTPGSRGGRRRRRPRDGKAGGRSRTTAPVRPPGGDLLGAVRRAAAGAAG